MTRLLDPRNGAAFDLSPCAGARTYVLASTPRSGSTLLARMLWDHGGAGAPKEYLNPMQLRDWEVRFGSRLSRARHALLVGPAAGIVGRRWSTGRIARHLARVRERRSSGGWFGLKLHWHHLVQHLDGRPPEDLLGPITWIRIRRADRLAQAVSWEIALQTGRWVDTQQSWRQPIYLRARVEARLLALQAAAAGWDEVIGSQPCLEVDYDALAADPARVVRGVLDHLGVPRRPMPSVPLRRMTHPLAAEWIARHRAGSQRRLPRTRAHGLLSGPTGSSTSSDRGA
jgi:LPS sulfotransferase NodH